MNSTTSLEHERLTRNGRWAPLIPTDHYEVAERNRAHDQDAISRGLAFPPNGWAELARWVDEGTWLRLLGEYRETQPAEYARMIALRPPTQTKIGDAR